MNFLAHSYLTFRDEHIVGQFVQDFIRNKQRFDFPPHIQEGIRLHREIDTFTDAHPIIHEAKKIFQPLVRLYAGAFIDVAFDHFLALSIPEEKLILHSQKVYRALRAHEEILPDKLISMINYMEKDNWLYNYRTENGILFSFKNVLNKAQYLDSNIRVFDLFLYNKNTLNTYFLDFFPDLEKHTKSINESFKQS